MASRGDLQAFAGTALAAGHDRHTVAAALRDAGWSEQEAADALDAWADTAFRPPVPRPGPYVSAREAFFYALMLVALASTLWALAGIAFAAIATAFPIAENARSFLDRAAWSVAQLVVFGPVLAWLVWMERQADRADARRQRSLLRRWFTYLTLLVAVLTLLGDLVWVISRALDGTLLLPTVLRAAVIAGLALAVATFYRRELHEDAART